MGLFGPKKQSYLGIDIGGGGIKLVELRNEKGRARLATYGFTEREPGAEGTQLVDSLKETAELLKKIALKARVSTMRGVAGLPISSVFNAVVTVPRATEKEIKDAVMVQAKKLIPVPLEEMVLDYKVIAMPMRPGQPPAPVKAKGDETKNAQVLITGAAKAMVQKYVAVFRLAGIELVSLETETFALIRSLIGKDTATTMIVDIGAVRTNIIIVENGIPYVTRSLDMGGLTLTKAVAAALGVELGVAERTKCDAKGLQQLYPSQGLPKAFQQTVATMITELRYSMSLYSGQEEGTKTVEKIILTGGSSPLPGIVSHFSGQLGTKSYLGDPWARVVCPDELRAVLEEIGPRFAVAIGLAMRDIE